MLFFFIRLKKSFRILYVLFNYESENVNCYTYHPLTCACFLGSALPLYTAMFFSQSDVRLTKKSTQPQLRPGWRQVAVHVFALPYTALR